ncbi:homoserine kinase [Helicobacter sp. 11S02629-2]|uniref:homoserine kinase n=1 Tax=Helicobacter sp. 11S02629-2 TaxID=1476195 RepID=UPI000BA57506|nr:homoserine kinase [Helicobacter sp. 11S02629-2]PAF45328.1 homoserine kinase [Helicobacter sp. 11S02629-2]
MNFSVPATSANLGPGFDSLGLSLNFRNFFTITPSQTQSIQINGEGSNRAKFLNDNMFVKIFKEVTKKIGDTSIQYDFNFNNFIPISRGLGSSSALIVGAIFSAYKLANKIPNKQEILNLALNYENHPDNITPAVFGGFNVSIVKHHKNHNSVITLRKNMPSCVRAVMVIPPKAMNTKYSRNILPKAYNTQDCVFNLSHASLLSFAFAEERWDMLKEAAVDRMHQDQRMRDMPVLFDIVNASYDAGSLMSTLSGSGSSIFSLCYEDDASAICAKLQSRFSKYRVFDVAFDNDGVKIEKF